MRRREMRHRWQVQSLVAFKSIFKSIFNDRTSISFSIKKWSNSGKQKTKKTMALARKKTILNNPSFKRRVIICFTPPICFTTSLPKGKPDGIPIRGVNIRHYNNLDRQSAYIAAFYEFS
jgi:hypothetical protein